MSDILITSRRVAWSHPHISRTLTDDAGYSLVATAPIAKGELLVVWGGIIVDTATLRSLPDMARHRSIQVEEDLHLTSGMVDDLATASITPAIRTPACKGRSRSSPCATSRRARKSASITPPAMAIRSSA